MMLHCTNCKKKFFQYNVNSEVEGKVVECKYCNQKLLFESRTKYLDNRLIELNKDLDSTESKINLRKQEYEEQILQLSNELNKKKEELKFQKLLQEKIFAFENRLKETEKLSSQKTELKDKIDDLNDKIKLSSDNISSLNKDIDEKTNYLENKLNSYDNDKIDNNESENNQISVSHSSGVVDINKHFEKSNKNHSDISKKNDNKKKNIFFSPSFIK